MDRAAPLGRLRFLLVFAGWATLAFVPAWALAHAWQGAVAGIAARIVAPRGGEIEMVDLELFYPIDVAVFAALCLASNWATWTRRARALLLGVPVMVGAEVLALTGSMAAIMGADAAAGDLAGQAAAGRLADALIRVIGLAVAAAAWFALIGRERFVPAREGARRPRTGVTRARAAG